MIRNTLTRRQTLASAAGAIVALGIMPIARPARADASAAQAALDKALGGATPREGRVSLQTPIIAENGNTVPFTVTVDSPMTAGDYVKAIHVLAEANPSPSVASFYLTPETGVAEVSLFMRLLKTQNVHAVAVMSDGSAWKTSKEVKVTIGGCGG